jgi:hypothetical protein
MSIGKSERGRPESEDLSDAAELLAQADAYHANLCTYQLIDSPTSEQFTRALEGARRQKLGERPDSLLSILLLGASGAGKSELLNALAGARIARSHHARPTTTRPTIYAHEEIPATRLFEFGTTLGTMASDPAAIVRHRREELRQKILIDAPDIDSFRTDHRRQVLELLPAVDVVLYVVTGWTYRDDIGWRTVLEGRGHRAVAFVMNKWDTQGRPPCRAGECDVDADFLRLLQSGGWDEPILFRTSAAWWSATRSRIRPESEDLPFLQGPAPSGDEFPALEEWLGDGLSTSEVAQIQRRKRRGLWGELAAAVNRSRPRMGNLPEFIRHFELSISTTQQRLHEQLRPAVEEAAKTASQQQRQDEAPDTPGPYGQISRLGRSLIQGFSGFRLAPAHLLHVGQLLSPPNPASRQLQPDTEIRTGRDERAAPIQGDPVASLVYRVLDQAAWNGRQQKIPVQWLEQQWTDLPLRASSEVSSALHQALTQTQRSQLDWRRRSAWMISWALDVILLTAVIATTYQLTLGLLLGQPSTAGFVLSFMALMVCVVILGNTAMAILLPNRQKAIARFLDKAVNQAAQAILRQPSQIAMGYLRDLEALDQQASVLEAVIDTQIQNLQQEIVQASEHGSSSVRPDTTQRLYATR